MMKSNISPIGWDWIKFGSFLIQTYDLDPLYPILVQAGWNDNILYRFLLAYWVYYSAGVACKAAESRDFYKTLFWGNEQHWPRGHERRHMRGKAFTDTVGGLMKFGYPEDVVEYMTMGRDFQSIGERVRSFTGFGPWISWKIADMTERVLQRDVSFDSAEIAVYSDPVKGAALIGYGDQQYKISVAEVHDVFDDMQDAFVGYMAPPYLDRPINIQELETVACKYKAHCNGHYPPGLDTLEIHNGLQGWGDLAQELDGHLVYYVRNLEDNYGIR